MSNKKVLIAAPIGDGKEYSINEWFKWISEQSYHNVDVAVCVNGKTQQSVKKKADLMRKVEINGKPIEVLTLRWSQYHTTKVRISESREILRRYAVRQRYDFIFWLDTDTIPLVKDAIQTLMACKKEAVSGLYFYKNSKQPIIIDQDTKTNITMRKVKELVKKNEFCSVWGFGFGCFLIAKSAFEKIIFDYKYMREKWTDDFQYCEYMEKEGIARWFQPLVICKHFHENDFTVGGGKKC